ncbi:ankyrin repeats (3 copies) domain-containing protein [Cordyceps javanica]|uniref:Ankyrin repeats (3 copies) domain-containing protein n=1 Tax=Cordyceps javanica TaxID=43265 RepID=A0A545WBN0_9HYPO|nr:ankyrin repeats (3 copies) domain-containing protein [Cordyceps javanica]TQW11336.1 ankyrin repeats (3 copies) domain-containing protein [Cordyceps javanica]
MRRELLRRRVNVKVLEHSRWSAVFMQEDPKDALLLLAEGLDPQREDAPHDQNDSGEIGKAPDHEVINEFSLLFWACTREDSVTLEALIKAGADPRAHAKAYGPYEQENQHETRLISLYAAPIFAAANARNSACMEFLIRNNHYQPSVDKIPEELLKHLVTHPQNIWKLGSYVPDCENTNVSGQFECLSLLFKNGLDRNASCGDSQTLLAHAAAEGYLCLVRRLHQHGVSIYDDPYGRGTPLIAALKAALDRKSRGEPHADQEHVAMYLIKHGAADPERAGVAATPVLGDNGRGMDDDGQQRNDHDPVMFRRGSDKSMAVLREALKLGNFRLIKELLDHWHDVNYRDSHSGQTGLMLAAANLNLEEPPRMRRPYFGDYHKQLCRPMVCSFLLTSGADLWMADHHGKTSFDHAGAKRETFELATMGRMESQYGKRNSDPEDELLSRYYRPQRGPPCGCCGPCEF